MPQTQKIPVSFRVTTRFKQLLELAAARDNRSQTNMLETLLFAHCVKEGIDIEPKEPQNTKVQGQ